MNAKSAVAGFAGRWLLAVALTTSFTSASAAVLLRLERISDTDVRLVGSGTLGDTLPAENRHSLYLVDPFSVRPAPLSNHPILDSSELSAGDFDFNFANDAGSGIGASFNNVIYIGRDIGVLPFPEIPSNEPLAGSMLLHLTAGATFAPIGASGEVYWGTTTGNIRGVLSGTWEMVEPSPVPLPGAIGLALGGTVLLRLFSGRIAPAKAA
ncbi:MAG: hypothetical protein AB7Q97_20235 [Gammaproteobacteria bacterium]